MHAKVLIFTPLKALSEDARTMELRSNYLFFSPWPKEGLTAAPTPLPEPQNSSFLHRLIKSETISAITKMEFDKLIINTEDY